MAEIKVGSWVSATDSRFDGLQQVISIEKDGYILVLWYLCYPGNLKLWEPVEFEECVFWNDGDATKVIAKPIYEEGVLKAVTNGNLRNEKFQNMAPIESLML